MIIRSQDKKMIINMDNLDTVCIESKNAINAYSGDTSTRSTIAIYSTEEKAIKVLDMICNAYERHSLFSITYQDGMISKLERCNGLNETRDLISPIFQMPSDEEVEV